MHGCFVSSIYLTVCIGRFNNNPRVGTTPTKRADPTRMLLAEALVTFRLRLNYSDL